MAVSTGKIQGKHREFNLNLNVATLLSLFAVHLSICEAEKHGHLTNESHSLSQSIDFN